MLRRLLSAVLLVLAFLLALPSVHAEGVSRALLIGCDLFVSQPDTSPAAANNVSRMQDAFSGDLSGFASITTNVSGLYSVGMLESLVLTAFEGAEEGDVSYFYISTHGFWSPGDDPEDMRLLLSDGLREDAVTAGQLRMIFDQIPGTKVLILDACHSGAVIGKGVHAPFFNVFAGGDYKVLCSSGGTEESWLWTDSAGETANGAGYFSSALYHGVSRQGGYAADSNRDGAITLTELRRYLLDHHGASTTRCYPEEDEFVFLRYDPSELVNGRRGPVIDAISFYSDVMDSPEPSADFVFTVRRPARVAYQLVHQEKGRWDFDHVSLLWDNTERYGEFGDASGYLSPGLKERTISIDREDEHSYGYVLLQMLTVDGAEPTLISSRVLCVPPLTGDPLLEFDMADSFMPSVGEEFTFVIMHRYPCEMSVVVEDAQGQVIRRLASRQATRPEHLRPLGSTWCWTGRLADGAFAPPGQYRIRATAHIGGENYTLTSGWFELTGEEVYE